MEKAQIKIKLLFSFGTLENFHLPVQILLIFINFMITVSLSTGVFCK